MIGKSTQALNSSPILDGQMTLADLEAIRSRISRAFRVVKQASGDGYETSYQAEGTEFMTRFRAVGLKAPEQLEDDFLNLFIWTWSLKDYLKGVFVSHGMNAQEVEDIANNSRALAYVADIANRAKHGYLQKSRSGEFAELVGVGFDVPQESIAQITFSGPEVTLHVKGSQLIRIRASVRLPSGEKMNALAVLTEAMDTWERRALTRIGVLSSFRRG